MLWLAQSGLQEEDDVLSRLHQYRTFTAMAKGATSKPMQLQLPFEHDGRARILLTIETLPGTISLGNDACSISSGPGSGSGPGCPGPGSGPGSGASPTAGESLSSFMVIPEEVVAVTSPEPVGPAGTCSCYLRRGDVRAQTQAEDQAASETTVVARTTPALTAQGTDQVPADHVWLIGSGRCYHKPSCGMVRSHQRQGTHMVRRTRADAQDLGKTPCGQCRPDS